MSPGASGGARNAPQLLAVVGASALAKPHSGQCSATSVPVSGGPRAGHSASALGTRPARMSVSCWTSAPRDHGLAALVLLAQAVDELGAQDVDLAVQDPPLVGDLVLLLGELLDQRPSAPGLSASRGRERSSMRVPLGRATSARDSRAVSRVKRSLALRRSDLRLSAPRARSRAARCTPSRTYSAVAVSASASPTYSSTSPSVVQPDASRRTSAPITGQTPSRPGQLMLSSTPRRSAEPREHEHQQLARDQHRERPARQQLEVPAHDHAATRPAGGR